MTVAKIHTREVSPNNVDEDDVWDFLASERDTKDAKFISHAQAYQKASVRILG